MPDRRFRCKEEYFKLCTSLYLTLPYLEPHSSLLLSPSSSLSLSPSTLPYLSLSPTANHRLFSHPFPPFPTPFVLSSPNKTKQNKTNQNETNETSPQHRVNNSLTFKIVVSYWAVPYLLGDFILYPGITNLP